MAAVWFSLEEQVFEIIKSQWYSVNVLLFEEISQPLLLVFEEKCLQEVLWGYPEPLGNFEQIQICFINLIH